MDTKTKSPAKGLIFIGIGLLALWLYDGSASTGLRILTIFCGAGAVIGGIATLLGVGSLKKP